MKLFKTDLFITYAQDIENMYVTYSLWSGWSVVAHVRAKDLGDGTYSTTANLSTHDSEDEAREALKKYAEQLEKLIKEEVK